MDMAVRKPSKKDRFLTAMIGKYNLFASVLFTALWTAICFGGIVQEVLPPLDALRSPVFLLIDLVFLGLGLFTLRNRWDIIMLLSFIAIVSVSAYLNHQNYVTVFNGLRSYFALIFGVPILRYLLNSKYSSRFIESFDKQLFILLCLHGVMVMFQFLRYGPGDYGGGLFGVGGSGQVSTYIYIASFYLLSKKWDFSKNFIVNLKANKIYFILLLPTFFNETKISFIYILVYFALLFPIDKKYISRFIVMSPFLLAAMLIGVFAYVQTTGNDKMFNSEAIDIYLSGGEDASSLIELSVYVQDEGLDTDELWALDLPRFTKLAVAPEALSTAKGGILFGAGVGQFKGGRVVKLTNFSREYNWLLHGSVVSSFWFLIELGVAGLVWLVVFLISMLRYPDYRPMAKNIKIYLAVIWFLILIYDQQMTILPCMFIMFYICMEGSKYKPLEPTAEQLAEHRG